MATRTIDYNALLSQIASQIGSPVEVETPQLGRVSFRSSQDLLSAVYLVSMLQAQSAGASATGVIVCGYDRGLSCPTNGGCE